MKTALNHKVLFLSRWRRYAYILMLKSLPYNIPSTKINSVEIFQKITNRNIQQVDLTAHKIVFTRVLVKNNLSIYNKT